MKNTEYGVEIDTGVIISKLNVKDDDTIIVTIDLDIFDLNDGVVYLNMLKDIFPNNVILISFKGMEFEVRKEDKND